MSGVNLSRRALFRPAAFTAQPLRPPWSLHEQAFVDLCTRCGDCISACPSRIINVGSGGFPEVDFSAAACSFCAECVAACTTGALQRHTDAPAWSYRARVKAECLSLQGIFCRSCGDLCDQQAISFTLQLGGKARPDVDLLACNGCGACVAPCPASAIVIEDTAHG